MNRCFFLRKNDWALAGFAILLAFLAACARPIPPTGGPKDTTPPKLDSLASTRNYQVRFRERSIRLKFDEWLVPPDKGQIVVSPPLVERPDVTLKGKTITFKFGDKEVLRPNTTYTINFGTAVKDLHEGNAVPDLRFVFSTGDFLDSLSVQGTVADALTGQFVENVAVMLYDTLYDSVAVKERPYYFATTDKSGQYIIRNVRAGAFKAVAVEDNSPQDLKWSGVQERIGFADSLLRVSDSTRAFLPLKIFVEKGSQRLVSTTKNRSGQLKLAYALTPENVVVLPDSNDIPLIVERDVDSLLIWYNLPAPRDWRVYVGSDTITVGLLTTPTPARRLTFQGEAAAAVDAAANKRRAGSPNAPLGPPPAKTLSFLAEKPARLPFTTPITAYDTTKWQLWLDSVRVTGIQIKADSAAPRVLLLNTAWQQDKNYRLLLLPGAITDFYSVTNADTLRASLFILSEKQLGGLSLTASNLKPGLAYVVQVLNGAVTEQERRFSAQSAEEKLVFKNLPAVVYTVRLIEDRDANGRWSTGSYFKHLQPEQVVNKQLEVLRPNWDMEATIDAKANEAAKGQKLRGN